MPIPRRTRWGLLGAGACVQRVPGLGGPELLTGVRGEGARRAHVHHSVGLEAGDGEPDGSTVGGEPGGCDGEDLFVDLGASVRRRGDVPPLLDGVGALRQLGGRFLRQGLGVGDIEPVAGGAHGLDVERGLAVRRELLQAEAEFAFLAPVPVGAEAAGVDGTVRSGADAGDAGLQALGVPEHGALVLAVHLLQVGALESAVGDVAEEHLPGERPLLQQHRCAGGVGDLVLRQPEHRLADRPVVERAVRVGVVVEEAVLLDVDQKLAGC